jgi:hypothetical protein
MEEMSKTGRVGLASLKAGMHRETGRKYLREGKLPSEMTKPRTWRTRPDPFAEDWPWVEAFLRDAPELEAKTLFELLLEHHPERYQPGQLRTLQRHIRRWRAQEGPAKEVFFAQEHRPGEAIQTDFTPVLGLGITIRGEPFEHQLCHMTLPYSNWEWATVCHSESMLALRHGVQEALFRLGRRPRFHQTDNSTAATHRLDTGKRAFNDEYLALMRHLGMEPRTIAIGAKNQNGDIESSHNALKNRIEQHLLVRGSADFDSVDEYMHWVEQIMIKANRLRAAKTAEELAVMRPVSVKRLREYDEETARVSSWSTIRVKRNAYSVPARLIGEQVKVRIYEEYVEVYYCDQLELRTARLVGRNGHRINYRHIIWSLVRKPGAFERYKYRDELFPSPTFRAAYDALLEWHTAQRDADLDYLRILHLAASTMESEVEVALELLLEVGHLFGIEQVKELVSPRAPEAPDMPPLPVDLSDYDALLSGEMKEAS